MSDHSDELASAIGMRRALAELQTELAEAEDRIKYLECGEKLWRKAESERDTLVVRCAGYRRIIKNIRDQATRNKRASDAQDLLLRDLDFIEDMALEILADPDAAAEELLKDRRRLEWLSSNLAYMMLSGKRTLRQLHSRGHGWAGDELRLAIDRTMQEEAKSDGD